MAFLRRAIVHLTSYGINIERLITDNGSAYRSAIYRSSTERNTALAGWLVGYNTRRPPGSLSHKHPSLASTS